MYVMHCVNKDIYYYFRNDLVVLDIMMLELLLRLDES